MRGVNVQLGKPAAHKISIKVTVLRIGVESIQESTGDKAKEIEEDCFGERPSESLHVQVSIFGLIVVLINMKVLLLNFLVERRARTLNNKNDRHK